MSATIDGNAILNGLAGFMQRHRATLYELVRRNFQLLEIAALMASAHHYQSMGYAVQPANLDRRNRFIFKATTTGNPRNYSWFEVAGSGHALGWELHANLPVQSAYNHDGGIYVVDVGVIRQGTEIAPVGKRQWQAGSTDLMTLAEVKAFPVYPMLLAHFLGIVHEIAPAFLSGRVPYGFRRDKHFPPTLFSTRGLSGTSENIIKAYPSRGLRVAIVSNLDTAISMGVLDSTVSIFKMQKAR
ncbi:hypothetical protein DFJ67_3524 [Asanoa ferruginea]|uniref:Uncharacterized protein n=1 Tax=Asanoa ferruginea TaxID=53367 RepID=A0A3D9ZNJ9_9ACTN|nr:hypothetical protein [Asanoa ferruginea]REF97523.1 hypothetical protein DFJ67_3524 [Asanoa ferruginea]GIF48187.1 hypothetical protein Afe04nite_27260 [Asanoa ferruginea]